MTAPYTAAELAAILARAEFLVERAEPDSHEEVLADNVVCLVAELTRAREALRGCIEHMFITTHEQQAALDQARAALGEEPADGDNPRDAA